MRRVHQILIGIVLFISLWTGLIWASRGVGPSWDEPDNIHAAGVYKNFFRSGFDASLLTSRDATASAYAAYIFTQEPSLARYPAVPLLTGLTFDVVVQTIIGRALTARELIWLYHGVSSFFFIWTVFGVYAVTVYLTQSRYVSLMAAIITFLSPTLFGYGISTTKDAAVLAFVVWGIYAGIRWVDASLAPDRVLPTIKRGIPMAILFGLGFASKINAIYIPVIVGIWGLIQLSSTASGFTIQKRGKYVLYTIGRMWISAKVLLVIGLVITILIWPYLWFSPLARLVEMITYFSQVGSGFKIFWQGETYRVGWDVAYTWYPLASLLYTIPTILLPFILIGMIYLLRALWRGRVAYSLLLIWCTVPLVRAFYPDAAYYDGIRHFIEVLPPIYITAAIGIGWVTTYLETILRRFTTGQLAQPVVLWVVTALLGLTILLHFPYTTGVYNIFAQKANVHYDRDFGALSIKEGVDFIHTQYGPMALWIPAAGHLSWYYLEGGDQYVYGEEWADSVILINKSSHVAESDMTARLTSQGFTKVHTISRGQAVFGWVYRKV